MPDALDLIESYCTDINTVLDGELTDKFAATRRLIEGLQADLGLD